MEISDCIVLGKGKKRIGRRSFMGRADFVHVEIDASVQSIGYSAFENCTAMESIAIPPSVTEIEADTFCGCTMLKRIEIPEGVIKIGSGAFRECALLSEVVLPSSLLEIDDDAFSGCKKLQDVRLPNGLTKLGRNAFSGCESLLSIEIPAVGSIFSSFENCTSLHTVRLIGQIEWIDRAFKGCSSLTTVVLPAGLKQLGGGVFDGCKALHEIEVPDTVERIGTECFKDCENLERFDCGENANFETDVFSGCVKLPDIVCRGVLIHSVKRKGIVKISDGVIRIAEHAFYNETGLTAVEFPGSLESIGREAFYGCAAITEISLPSGLKDLGSAAFAQCTSLEKVSLPSDIEVLSDSLFAGCSRLATVSAVGAQPMAGCCVISPLVKGINDSTFKGCAFKSITLPPGLVRLENFAFADNDELIEVDVQKLPPRVCYHVFGNCKGLKKIRLSYQNGYKNEEGDLRMFAGCAIDEAVIPDYLESRLGELFGEYIPQNVSLVCKDGSVRPLEQLAKRDETEEDRALFTAYGIHRDDIKYSYEAGYDVFAGCRMQSPAKESRSVVIPERYKDGDARTLIAKIYTRGSSKRYSVRDRDSNLESYSLQRNARKSKFWPVFAALAAYKPEPEK